MQYLHVPRIEALIIQRNTLHLPPKIVLKTPRPIKLPILPKVIYNPQINLTIQYQIVLKLPLDVLQTVIQRVRRYSVRLIVLDHV
jgi:hypothetical protein